MNLMNHRSQLNLGGKASTALATKDLRNVMLLSH